MSPTPIELGHRVSLKYTVEVDSRRRVDYGSQQPLEVVVGSGQLVAGLEQALLGRVCGEMFELSIPPEQGFGTRDTSRVIKALRRDLPRHFQPELGLELTYPGDHGEPLSLWITAVEGEHVTLDGNHPFAGCTLKCSVEICAVMTRESERGLGKRLSEVEDDFETGHTTH